jgi:hypothetical protein
VEESAVVAMRKCLTHFSNNAPHALSVHRTFDRTDNSDEEACTINRRRIGTMNEGPANKRMQRTKSAHRPRTAAFAADPQRWADGRVIAALWYHGYHHGDAGRR